jgi:hypothetical protein
MSQQIVKGLQGKEEISLWTNYRERKSDQLTAVIEGNLKSG